MKQKPYLVYDEYTDTIRQMPGNYMIARRRNIYDYWIVDPDISANKNLATKVFLALFIFDLKYGKGETIIKYLAGNLTLAKIS